MNRTSDAATSDQESLEEQFVGRVTGEANREVDPRRAFLLKASIRYDLVERGEADIDIAFNELTGDFLEIVFPRPKTDADVWWDQPSWRDASVEYHGNRRSGR